MPPKNVVWLDAIGSQPRVPRQLGDEACRLTVDIKDGEKRLVLRAQAAMKTSLLGWVPHPDELLSRFWADAY
jgi:hypothetical protein